MKVLFVAGYVSDKKLIPFSKIITGYGYMVKDIAVAVRGNGVEVDVFTQKCFTSGGYITGIRILPRSWGLLFRYLKTNDIVNGLKAAGKVDGVKHKLKQILYYLSLGYFRRIVYKGNYDVIHFHGITWDLKPLIDFCDELDTNYVVTLHGLNSFDEGVKIADDLRLLERDFLTQSYLKNKKVTCISTGVRDRVLQHLNCDKSTDNFNVVLNGTHDVSGLQSRIEVRKLYSIPEDSFVFCCVGNISARKNQIQLVRAYRLLPQEWKRKVYILFLGNDKSGSQIINEIGSFGDHLILCGDVKRSDVHSYYSQSNFNILASISEGFGLSIIEGFMHGLPTLCFNDIDIIPDIYCDKVMLPINERTDQALMDGVINMTKRSWDRVSIKKYAQQFSLQSTSLKYINLYKELYNRQI
ncbi:glycosyltransferase family 4 protein [Albibacterium sp.]|uniref:glycosyltransferase family 4 protein n=1 Tax=Albibacterium sp. TaxID=2952885 RepID=UPI002C662D33|nr:glycosyltransferase family 4 protein [Albibacterium sp.]HUH17999.1 glycosyltransferase family 4 protein [Albibacterium sp.]